MSDSTAPLIPTRLGTISRILAMALLAAAFVLLPNIARADSTATYDISGSLAQTDSVTT